MRFGNRRVLALTAGLAAAALLTGCGAGTTASPTPAETDSGEPVTIDFWSWDPLMQPVVDAFNESQDRITVNYVLQPTNVAMQTNFRNVMESGKDVPCLARGFAPLSTSLVNGWAQDITQYVEPVETKFSDGALAAAKLGDKYYGVPTGADAKFMMVNEKTLDAAGVEAPKTWEELVETGKELAPSGVKVINLAGEDPSTLINLAQQAGAQWFTIDGDSWKVNLHGKETLKAADIIQEIVDNDLNSTQTYQDRPALYAYFDSGNLATLPTQWWSLTGLQTNFTQSLGDWEAVPSPQFEGAKGEPTAGSANAWIVPVGCEHPDAAMNLATFIMTDPEGIEASRNPDTNAVGVPVSLKDVAEYSAAVVPDQLFGQSAEEVGEVIAEAQANVIGSFEGGPNYDAWFPQLQDQWGKVIAKQITVEQALENVEEYIASDLESKGISYSVAK
ncbi:multiple sugar transport system substrate-binding protein [Microbacterium foliorum]|uniref:Multiple sugar transport system substrate-binding protein n=1 Tax=Microbacterium foliorum TaxID=104336 RepID=A0ABU1HVH6_9MICO|nr:extracellular solute-binding protein [Microbacterium foliorum]MDR6144054.1 multiple sugar transport system substrate-binding protein [Microbacterium foliorum]